MLRKRRKVIIIILLVLAGVFYVVPAISQRSFRQYKSPSLESDAETRELQIILDDVAKRLDVLERNAKNINTGSANAQ